MRESYLLIESSAFSNSVKSAFLSDSAYSEFQSALVNDPEKGDVITGAAPLRKIRWHDRRRGKGKRGGLRVIYIHIPELKVLYLLDVYDKDEVDDLSSSEKKELQGLANALIKSLKERHERGML